ncbi:hypothetical protein N836_31330 [Leptolyngbya sp. Heron Island J]|uniref:hypothetical protein n=1 Tax=Leptolyngbya sp. Heron Island J TaxID=1385935 RepID=UPI0003B9B8D0|nr:hypothetical protein [Leptolyngbya sp. Heron Island J]ESA38434.1 hypothetical protein N836_31330 [Leptolyngbya sp. Heron Island J]
MPELKDFYVVRHPNNQFEPTQGKEPTGFIASAKRFSSIAEAEKGASEGAVGISLYGYEGGKPIPLKHMPLSQGKTDNAKPTT